MMQKFYVDQNGKFIGSYDGPDEDTPSDMVDGIEVPTPPQSVKQAWRDGAWSHLPVSSDMLTAELNKRLSAGFDFDFGDERGIHHFGTTPDDMARWTQEVTPLAQAAMNRGEPARQIGIKTDTGATFVTASEWWDILDAAAAWRQPLYAAYFALKALPEIPPDYASNPDYWQ